MRHLATIPCAQGLQALWMLDQPAPITGEMNFELVFSRLAMGIGWQPGGHAVVGGERVFEYRDKKSTFYVVLDERQTPLPHTLLDILVELKDAYRIGDIFLPNAPADATRGVVDLEGLVYYRETDPARAVATWPSFLDFELTAAVRPIEVPSEAVIHQDLERLLQEQVIDPKTDRPLVDMEGRPTPKLLFPVDLPILATQAGLRQGQLLPCTALWMAVLGLARSKSRTLASKKEPTHVHQPNPHSGY